MIGDRPHAADVDHFCCHLVLLLPGEQRKGFFLLTLQ